MGGDVSRHYQPTRQGKVLRKSLCRLKHTVEIGRDLGRQIKAAEQVRIAQLALIKAKRDLIAEYPQRDLHGRQLRNLEIEEDRWLSLAVETIINEQMQG